MFKAIWSGIGVSLIVGLLAVELACSSDGADSPSEATGSTAEEVIRAPANGGVVTIAGTGAPGFIDNAAATSGTLNDPSGIAVASAGTIYVADWGNNAVRRIPASGALETLFRATKPNLVRNSRAETPPSSPGTVPLWTVAFGSWGSVSASGAAACSPCGSTYDGSRWFYGLGGILQQEFPVVPTGPNYYLAAKMRGPAGLVNVRFFDSAGGELAAGTRSVSAASVTTWTHREVVGPVPAGAVKIRVSLQAHQAMPATYFDAVEVRFLAAGDQGLSGTSSVAIDTAADGTEKIIVGANKVYALSPTGTKLGDLLDPPGVVTSIAPVSDGYLYFADSTQADLYVRSGAGVNYRAKVGGAANAEPLSVAATVQGTGNHRLWVAYRSSSAIRVYDCAKSTIADAIVTCTLVSQQIGATAGFVDDMDGTPGGARLSFPQALAVGRFGDLLIAEEGNNAVRRSLFPLTQTSAGAGIRGFLDGVSNQARFSSPSGVAAAPDGSIIVADRLNNRIRKIRCAASNACVATPGMACTVLPVDDGQSCTSDSCLVLAVNNAPLANGSACSDGNACTGPSDTCSSGVCGGSAVPIDDGNLCTVDACDPATGVTHTQKTFTDPTPNDCLVPECDLATGNAKSVPAPEGAACAEQNSGRYCDHAGACEVTPAPTFTAPTLDTSTGTNFSQLTDGIWNGASRIQTGVAVNKIEPGHAGWLIGQVKSAAGNAMPNVEVSIAGDASFGKTRTRADGRFDLIVNGGRSYTVRFEKAGHLPVDRQVYVGWEETSAVDGVILLTLDPSVTAVNFGINGSGSTAQQIATGTKTTDAEGERTGKLLLPKGIKATVNGNLQASLKLRITEYTIGADGPVRMPAPLPPNSAYTYAVELSADEANGQWVQFSKPAYYYVENFISRADGTRPEVKSIVPSGYYNRTQRAWLASDNGIVIKVLKGKESIAPGSPAEVDVTNDGIRDLVTTEAMSALKFTNDELIALREYSDGQTLWRIPISHMTPWDFNFARFSVCAGGCDTPLFDASAGKPPKCETTVPGSIIGCESQSLGETFDVAGTPFSLNYNSSRLPLYANWRTLTIGVRERPKPIGQGTIAAIVKVTIAGKVVFHKTFLEGPATTEEFSWDGLDAFGRPVVGSATATIDGHWHGTIESRVYTNEFGVSSGGSDDPPFKIEYLPFLYSYRQVQEIAGFSPLAGKGSWSLGGWTLSPHHFYDAKGEILYEGSGRTRQVDPGLYTLKRAVGSGGGTAFAADDTKAAAAGTGAASNVLNDFGIAAAPNGNLYYTDPGHNVIRRVNSLGQVRTIAGKRDESRVPSNTCNPGGDGGDSVVSGRLATPRSLAFGRDGELYFYDRGDFTIRVLRPSGPDTFNIDTVAGVPCTVASSYSNDVAAKDNPLPDQIDQIAVGPDGAIYFGDKTNRRIRRFYENGKISTVAGNGSVEFQRIDGALATDVGIGYPSALALSLDGSIYSSNGSNLFKVTPDGKIKLLSGLPPQGTTPPLENRPSIEDYVYSVSSIAVAPDGRVVFNDSRTPTTIRQIDPDGTVRSISRAGTQAPIDGSAALGNGTRNGPATRVVIAPDGSTLVYAHNSIYRISTGQASPATACADAAAAHVVPSGDEAFCFNASGRHLSTINWRTGKKLFTFDYDVTSGRLKSIVDANGLQTGIGMTRGIYTITAPFLQSTTISASAGNTTSIRDSLGNVVLTPAQDGRLIDLTDRNGNQFFFGFTNGLLTSDRSPLSPTPQTLVRSAITDGYRVTHTTPLQRVTTYDVIRGFADQDKSVLTFPNGTQRIRTEERDGTTRTSNPDGSVVTVGVPVPDPVWGFKQPIGGKRTFTLPTGGLSMTTSEITCPVTTSGSESTQFSAVALNPSKDLACNTDVPADPLAEQVTPAFSNPPYSSTKRVWDTTGETITRTSRVGRVQTQKRDAKGRVTMTQIGSLTPVLYTYDPTVGRQEQLTFIDRGVRRTKLEYRSKDELDPTTQQPYSDAGFAKRITNTLGYATDFNRDIFGRPKKIVEAVGAGTTGTSNFEWDGNGSLALVKPPGRPSHLLHHNSVNLLDLYTPPTLSDVPNPATTLETTEDRTPDTETRPDGVVVEPTYVTSPTNTGQLDKVTFSGGSSPSGIVDYEYYQSTDTNYASGQAPGKLKSIAGPYGTTQLTFAYNGSLPTAVSWNKVLSSTELPASVGWGYNSNLLRSRETVSPITGTALTRFFGYDADHLLTCNSSTSTTTCASLAASDLKLNRSTEHGGATGLNFGGLAKLSESWDYSDSAADAGGQVDTDGIDKRFGELRRQFLSHGTTTTKLAEIVYDAAETDTRDAAGRIVTKTETFPAATAGTFVTSDIVYSYDERGRLENVTIDGLDSEEFGYDANGNRTSFIPGVGTALSGTYDNQDRLLVYGTTTTGTAVGDVKYSYGKNGELAKREIRTASGVSTWTYSYDALGNLITVVKPGASATTYTYLVDGVGRRIGKKEKVGTGADTVKKRWLYRDQLSPVAELTSAGALAALYVYGSRPNTPDLVIKPYVDANGITKYKTYRLFSDQLGSPRLAVNVDDQNDIPYRVDYSAFGVPSWKGIDPITRLPTPPAFDWIPFGFAGGLYDPQTELVRFGARDYDPSVGRWVSKDPIRFDGLQANLYVYVGNDAINRRDPAGLYSLCDALATAGGWGACQAACSFATRSPLACGLACSMAGSVAQDAICGDPPKPPAPCPPGTIPNPEPGWANPMCVPFSPDCTGSSCECDGADPGPQPEPDQTVWY